MAPAGIAAAALGIAVDAVGSTERIKHGLTNESWLVRAGGDAVVVRISNTAQNALQIDRDSEAGILAATAAAGIGPPVLLCEPARHVLVTRYLGATWTREDATRERNIERLARLLRRLHGLAVPPGVHRVELISSVEGYLDTLDEHGARSELTALSLRERARRVAGKLRESRIACLCHNDVHHLNIIDDGELRLIDWEYAGRGDPAFDLASTCVSHRYDDGQRERLLAAYASQQDSMTRDRLELACWLFEYISDLWMAVREVVAQGQGGAGRP
jgi:thiamine kinase